MTVARQLVTSYIIANAATKEQVGGQKESSTKKNADVSAVKKVDQ
jgi:hypothetical protein